MKSKNTKIQILKKGILLILMLALVLPSSIYATASLTLQASTAIEKLLYGEIGSVVNKIEEHFKSNTTLYIVNEIQLRAFAEYVNKGNSCQGKKIILLNNIVLDTDTDWTPIGNSYSEFSGTFDGNGYTISNLTYKCRENYVTESGYYNIGLFGVISKHGKVQNVKVNNSNIVANGLDTTKIFNVGNIAGTNYGTILDCSANKMPLNITKVNEGTEDNNYVGLLVGENKNNNGIKFSENIEPSTTLTFEDGTKIEVDLEIYKNDTQITDFLKDNNFKIDDKIKLKFIIDTYLYTGLEDGKEIKLADKLDDEGNVTEEALKENYPLVTVGNAKLLPVSSIQEEIELEDGSKKPQTTLVYEYMVTNEEELKNNNASVYMNFEKNIDNENLYVYYSEDAENFYTGDRINKRATTSNLQLNLDSELPSVELEAYVEELSESNRYPEGKEIIIKLKSTEQIQATVAPELNVSFSESGLGKYNYQENKAKGNAVHVDALLDGEGKTTWIYSYIIEPGDEGILNIEYLSGTITDLVGNIVNITEIEVQEVNNIYADTTAPIVVITPNVQNSITKQDTVTYEIKWSEEVVEFTKENITVNNGEITELVKNEDGTYTVTVKTGIEDGNVGDLQVIIEENACKDLVGHGNVRTESVIRIDRKAAVLESLEAYIESEIKLNSEVDVVKEYYKTGEKIIVVATFDENIASEKVPELVLQFSESGNSVIPQGIIDSNKIIYTYTIAEGDEGTVSVRAFNGTVIDAAGNETKVVRKSLDGNTIIVDTKVPSLKELNVATDAGTYNAGKTITIEAIYDENVYALKDNEIKNISLDIAPTLKVKFGSGEEREATFNGYAGEDKTKLIYQTTIIDTDNGELSIVSYENKENVKVCDIAGNVAELNNKQTGNEIIADNIRPVVENITAVVENPTISGTDIYYKEGNSVKITLTFSENVSGANIQPKIKLGFSEIQGQKPEMKEYSTISTMSEKSETIEYIYQIKDGDNGYLWVEVLENEFVDIAGNKNEAKEAEEKLNVYADTIIPTVTLYKDTEELQNNQTITIKATFNENVYDLDDTTRITLTKLNAPKLIYSFGDGENKEIGATSIDGATITYTIRKDSVDDNGDLHYELAKGNLCDRAGNELYRTTLDTTAPVLESVVITSNAGAYSPYCKEGKEIYVIATFDESIKIQNMKLEAKLGDKDLPILDGQIVEGNSRQIKFTYTVQAGDMGEFKIVDICGESATEDKEDYGWVRDEHGNQNNIYSLEDEKVTPTGKAEADTKDPYITSIEAEVDGETIATYTKEEGKDAVITVGRTNENIVEYVVTYNEKVDILDKSKISIENGIIRSIEYTNFAFNEFRITVQTTVEGVQSLIINEATVEDKAGNTDEFVRLNAVTVDFTKPTVRFISEYNGGAYVLPTNIGKVEIRPNVEISEDIAKIEYKWDDEKDYVKIENYSSSSDIAIPTKAFTEAGIHVLHIRVVDLAGNDYETSKTYEIKNSNINIELSTYEYTNRDITSTVSFGEGLTDNRKVTFKAEGLNEIVELNAIGTDEKGNTQYTITENGTIYAEATDRVGNKVFTEDLITNIDKENPEITIELNGANLVIGTGKDKATIKTNVETKDNNWVEEAKYVFLTEDIDINNITAEQKAKIANKLENEAKIEDAVSGTYYLYVLAKDKAGNETVVKSNVFTVVDTNERGEEENKVPAEKPVDELIIFEQMKEDEKDKAYVSVNHDYSIIEDLEITLKDETYGYVSEYDSVELYGNTKILVKAWDVCGNEVTHEYEVKDIVGPEFTISGNPEVWTNGDVELEVYSNAQLKALTLNGKNILGDNKYRVNTDITEYGNYTFEATDIYNNTSKQTIEVKIDKADPEITDVKIEDGKIVITANDIDKTLNKELSGLAEYAITDTTEVPLEWSKSNVINVTKDANFFVWVKDNAGNITMKEEIVVRDITAPELTITTDVKLDKWTNTDVKVDVKSNEELSSLVLKYKEMVDQEGQMTEEDKEENILDTKTYTITSNGTYEIIGTDKSGNSTKETIIVSKIDKDMPVISEVVNEGKDITITAADEGSGVKEYAITSTTEEPVEWSSSNVIKVTEDGIFYAWVKDNAGNVSRVENAIIVDTTAPIVTFNYLSQTVTVGMPVEANVFTNEDAIISYSWDKETWVSSEGLISSMKVSEKTTTPGKYTLYVKAKDATGNESKVQTLEFEVTTIEEIKQPDIIFEDIPTVQVNGARYVKVSSQMTTELLTDSMNKEALCGKTPEYTKLTEDGKLRTGSEITINGQTKYIVVVNGDVDGDGKVTFLGDIVKANDYRIGIGELTTIQMLAGDINNNGKIEFISDIVAMNDYRLGIINSL